MTSTALIIEALGGPRLLKARRRDEDALIERVRAGLPYSALEAMAARFGIGPDEVVSVLRLPARTLARRKKEGRLTADESDRLLRLGRIAALAEEVLGHRERAGRWLHQPNRALGDVAPLRRLDTDLGAKEVEQLLIRIAHGVPS
jgi:putative toxin-antitoxin system antitoxin component (TIGR02293 family)